MKRVVLLVACLMLVSGAAVAENRGYGVFLGYGQGSDDTDIFRLGMQRAFPARWFQTDMGYLSGYFEMGVSHWKKSGDDINGLSFAPVAAYYFRTFLPDVLLYLEGGIGAICIDDYHIGSRNLSTNFLFEDRIGVGLRIRSADANLRFLHYSNASVRGPNDGLDVILGTLSWHF